MEQADGSTPGGGGGFGELYREHFRPLLGVSVALVGSRERAEEIVQDAFATTFDHYARLDDPVKTVRRAVLRGCAGQKPVPDDPTRSTERVLSRVRELPRPQRDAVALHHGLGLEAPEIDRTLGLQAGAAALRLEQAGTQLRSSLEVGNDLDHTLTRAFADTTLDLGHLLARPGEAQRRVYRRRRIRVAAGVTAAVIAAVVLFVLVRPSGETVDAGGGTTAGATDTADATGTTDATDATDASGATTTSSAPESTTTSTTPTTASPAGTYTVVDGDGWYAIAQKLDVPVERLLEVNGATLSDPLFVGQELQVPPPAPTT